MNDISGTGSHYNAIGGGNDNNVGADSDHSTIAGGLLNNIGGNSESSVIGGGRGNNIAANSRYATIPGGDENFATNRAFAAGSRAKAIHPGAFVWADGQPADFASTSVDQVSFRCQGGVRFTSGFGAENQTVEWMPWSASWSFSSDRNLKEGVRGVDAQGVLEKVSRLPIAEWSFKGHPQRHIGPMAQDFHSLFRLSNQDTMLDSGDLHGVALAAIQGLNQKLSEELKRRDAENAALKEAVGELKAQVELLTQKLAGGPQ